MNKSVLAALFAVLCVGIQGVWAAPQGVEGQALDAEVFARIDGEELGAGVFLRRLRVEMQQTFYHGRAPEAEVAAFRDQVADQLVAEFLLAREARRRGLVADPAAIQKRWQELDERNADNPQWEAARARLKDVFERDWEREELAKVLVEVVRDVPEATEQQAREFYEANTSLFLEPASHRISMILLGVDPGAGEAAWKESEQRAEELYQQLQQGADFAELATLHSTDYTADQGGDMGVVHEGMVGADVQHKVEQMAPGEVSEPMRLLQGVALFKLVERKDEVQHSFEVVRERAGRLWRREQAELAEELKRFELRQAAEVAINEALVALPGLR